MREITEGKDYGFEPRVRIEADDRDPFGGGTSNLYELRDAGAGDSPLGVFAFIQFQHGPRNDPKSKPGITDAHLLHVLIDRYEGFQAGPYACEENEAVLFHLRAALANTRKRADARAAQGVLGKNEQHTSRYTCSVCGEDYPAHHGGEMDDGGYICGPCWQEQ